MKFKYSLKLHYVQTPTFRSFFMRAKLWNQMFGLLHIHYKWIRLFAFRKCPRSEVLLAPAHSHCFGGNSIMSYLFVVDLHISLLTNKNGWFHLLSLVPFVITVYNVVCCVRFCLIL